SERIAERYPCRGIEVVFVFDLIRLTRSRLPCNRELVSVYAGAARLRRQDDSHDDCLRRAQAWLAVISHDESYDVGARCGHRSPSEPAGGWIAACTRRGASTQPESQCMGRLVGISGYGHEWGG